MKKASNSLLAKIRAVNAVNAEVNRLAPLFRAYFVPFFGQRVTKIDGTLRRSVSAGLPKTSFHIYSPHVGCFTVKTHETVDGIVHYGEAHFYAFTESHEGICEGLKWEWVDHKTDYCAETILATRKKIEKLREELSALESEVSSFARVY